MPHRFLPIASEVFALCGCAFASIVSAIALLAELPAGVLDDERMRLMCVIGAVGGGVVSALLFSPPKSGARQIASWIAASSLTGIFATPPVILWLAWPIKFDTVAPTAAGLALVAVMVLRAVVPVFTRWMETRAKDRFRDDDPRS